MARVSPFIFVFTLSESYYSYFESEFLNEAYIYYSMEHYLKVTKPRQTTCIYCGSMLCSYTVIIPLLKLCLHIKSLDCNLILIVTSLLCLQTWLSMVLLMLWQHMNSSNYTGIQDESMSLTKLMEKLPLELVIPSDTVQLLDSIGQGEPFSICSQPTV